VRRGLAVLGLAVALGVSACGADVRRASPAPSDAADGAARIARAFELREHGVPVEAAGEVVRLLPDDRDGSRHQRFVLRLATGQTVLVAHNVDLAPRVEGLERGDRVAFRGEYEWSEEGGVVHWTHRDPAGMHPGGWLRFAGRTYD
jgi:hypothetical protein